MKTIAARINQLVDNRLLETYQDATKHYGTADLVLVYDEANKADPVSVYSRGALGENPELPESLASKISKPASQAKSQLNSSDAAFWLIAFFSDGEFACTAIKGKLLADSGNA